MKTVTVKIPASLDAKLREAAKRRDETFSELARRTLSREIEDQEINFAELAAPYRGMFKGLPNLSSREGYGDGNDR